MSSAMLTILILGLFFTSTLGGPIQEKKEDHHQKQAAQKSKNSQNRVSEENVLFYATPTMSTTRYRNTTTPYYCPDVYCNYHGKCHYWSTGDYYCKCRDGFIGSDCESVDFCDDNPCLNMGYCHQDDSGFNCSCPSRYIGRYCEKDNYCVNSPCLNGGICESGRYDFNCTCPPGYTGRYCEQGRDKSSLCEKNLCLNGGTCHSFGNSSEFVCKCDPQYFGSLCEKAVDSKAPILLVQMEKVSSLNSEKINLLSAGGNIVINGTGNNNNTGVSPFSNFFTKMKKMLGLDNIF